MNNPKVQWENEHMNHNRIKYCIAMEMSDVDKTQSPHEQMDKSQKTIYISFT